MLHCEAPALEEVPAAQSKHCPLTASPPVDGLEPGARDEYDATNPSDVTDPSDVKRTIMYPVDDDTGLGSDEPLKGLPESSVLEEQDAEEHEYTRTKSLPDSVLKDVNESVTVLPGVDMMTEQS